jgi:hypothetical protein
MDREHVEGFAEKPREPSKKAPGRSAATRKWSAKAKPTRQRVTCIRPQAM